MFFTVSSRGRLAGSASPTRTYLNTLIFKRYVLYFSMRYHALFLIKDKRANAFHTGIVIKHKYTHEIVRAIYAYV